jgi:hypothetical protein
MSSARKLLRSPGLGVALIADSSPGLLEPLSELQFQAKNAVLIAEAPH